MKDNKLTASLAELAATHPTPTPAPTQTKIEATPINLIDSNPSPADEMPAGSGDFDRLFTRVHFEPVSGETYAREQERRNRPVRIVGHSRKVANVQIELAGTGAYTPGTISIVQGIAEKTGHLEMSIGVWNPDTKKSSLLCADAATKDRLQEWKDRTCAQFQKFCTDNGIDLAAPAAARQHANAVAVNLMPSAPSASQ